MSKDIREMFKNSNLEEQQLQMPKGHEERFLKRLEGEVSEKKETKNSWFWLKIVATAILFLAVGYFTTTQFNANPNAVTNPTEQLTTTSDDSNLKTLGDVSPDLKKVENYYLAAINSQLAEMKVNKENKDLIDGYLKRLDELNKEYLNLSKELTENGPNELTVNALIDNLKLRLNLLLRLREQLQSLGITDTTDTIS